MLCINDVVFFFSGKKSGVRVLVKGGLQESLSEGIHVTRMREDILIVWSEWPVCELCGKTLCIDVCLG